MDTSEKEENICQDVSEANSLAGVELCESSQASDCSHDNVADNNFGSCAGKEDPSSVSDHDEILASHSSYGKEDSVNYSDDKVVLKKEDSVNNDDTSPLHEDTDFSHQASPNIYTSLAEQEVYNENSDYTKTASSTDEICSLKLRTGSDFSKSVKDEVEVADVCEKSKADDCIEHCTHSDDSSINVHSLHGEDDATPCTNDQVTPQQITVVSIHEATETSRGEESSLQFTTQLEPKDAEIPVDSTLVENDMVASSALPTNEKNTIAIPSEGQGLECTVQENDIIQSSSLPSNQITKDSASICAITPEVSGSIVSYNSADGQQNYEVDTTDIQNVVSSPPDTNVETTPTEPHVCSTVRIKYIKRPPHPNDQKIKYVLRDVFFKGTEEETRMKKKIPVVFKSGRLPVTGLLLLHSMSLNPNVASQVSNISENN